MEGQRGAILMFPGGYTAAGDRQSPRSTRRSKRREADRVLDRGLKWERNDASAKRKKEPSVGGAGTYEGQKREG